MKPKKQQLTDFIQKERFELQAYITHLFDHSKTRLNDEKNCRQMNIEHSLRP
jgi:hypothetical protein